MVDIRWVVLVTAFIFVTVLIRKRKEWAEPLLVGVAVVTILATVLFFITAPVFGS